MRSLEDVIAGLDKNGNVKRTGTIVETVQDMQGAVVRVRNWYRARMQWTVSVQSGDRLYDAALRWFLSEESDTAPPRAVKAMLGRRRPGYSEWDDIVSSRDAGKPVLNILYDEKGSRTILIEGHKVQVLVSRQQQLQGPADSNSWRSTTPDSLHFYTWSYDAQQAVLRLLEQIANDTQKAKPALHMMSNWGDWMRRDDLPERQLNSVVLAAGQMERLRDDLQSFIADEDEYVRRGMPYHRGYLLYGPPGTGKTSIVRALAAHFGLDLWYAPLGDLQKDTGLLTLINQVRPGSILLLEDIDVFQATHNRTEENNSQNGLSTAGLLNALDGVATPHGLITFMTTNDKSIIDPAILRPGRIDVQEEIGMPSADQIRRLYNSWFATELDAPIAKRFNNEIAFTGSTAQVTEILKQHLDDPEGAWIALQQPVAEERSVTVAELEEKRNERRQEGSSGGSSRGQRGAGSST